MSPTPVKADSQNKLRHIILNTKTHARIVHTSSLGNAGSMHYIPHIAIGRLDIQRSLLFGSKQAEYHRSSHKLQYLLLIWPGDWCTGVNRRYQGVWISKQRQGLILDSGLELDSLPWSSWSLPDLKGALVHLYYDTTMEWVHAEWQSWLSFVGKSMQLARDPALDCVIHQHMGANPSYLVNGWDVCRDTLFTTMGSYGYKPTCGILLCRRGEVLSVRGRVVYLVLKRSFTVLLRLLDVLFGSGCVLVCFCGFCFCFWFEFLHPVFCTFTCSPTARDQLTDHATS